MVYATGATDRGLAMVDHRTHVKKLGVPEADGVHLSGKEKSMFSHRFTMLVKALKYSWLGRGASVHPAPISLMLVLVGDAQSLETDHRSAMEHLMSTTKTSRQ